jgi:polysaccharide biosynthesis/export protein
MNTKMIKTFGISLAGCLVLAGFAAAQNSQNQTVVAATTATTPDSATAANTPADKGFQTRRPRYKLEAGDSFDISFELNPEFNQTVTVQPDGYITLRGVGDVAVKGQTVPELTETLRGAYGKILNNPLVSVVLKDFEKPYFIADGQVGHPGKYDLRGEVTLTEAIAIAGGFTEASKHSQVVLFRKASEGWYTGETFNVKQMERTKNLQEDPQLRPGDMLFVPKNRFSKGKVLLPGSSLGAFFPLPTL